MTVSRRRRPLVAALASLTLLAAAACGSDDESSESENTAPAATDAAEEEPTADTEPAATEPASGDQPAQAEETERPTIVVTTNILGDVLGEVVGDQADIVTIMPVGADPHDFQASAQQVDQMVSADALIVNGADFEEGLLDVIDNARGDGVPTYEAIESVATIEFGEGGHDHGEDEHGHEEGEEHSDEEGDDHAHEEGEEKEDEHAHEEGEEHSDEEGDEHAHEEGEEHSDEEGDEHAHEEGEEHSDEEGDEHAHEEGEEHSDEEKEEGHSDEHGHDHEGADPHFFTDPMRMAAAVNGIVGFLTAQIPALDADALEASAAAYVAELEALDAANMAQFESIAEENRVLVTNHEVFGYFADRYGFEVVGAVIPSGSTLDTTSGGELAELAELIEAEGVPAIFSDTSASDELIQTLADEVGDVQVIELFTESLGEAGSGGETYLLMVGTNAERITAGLS